LRVSARRNLFPLLPARRYVLVAGGIGVTPLLSMAEQLACDGVEFALHHYASSPAEAPLLEQLRAASFGNRTHIHHSCDGDSVRTGLPPSCGAPTRPRASTSAGRTGSCGTSPRRPRRRAGRRTGSTSNVSPRPPARPPRRLA